MSRHHAHVPQVGVGRFAGVVEPFTAILADRLQGAVAGSAGFRARDQQALLGQPGQDRRDRAGHCRRPAASTAAAWAVKGAAKTETRRKTACSPSSSSA